MESLAILSGLEVVLVIGLLHLAKGLVDSASISVSKFIKFHGHSVDPGLKVVWQLPILIKYFGYRPGVLHAVHCQNKIFLQFSNFFHHKQKKRKPHERMKNT